MAKFQSDLPPTTKVVGATYGPPKGGKTVASLRAFSGGLFVGPKGCFIPAHSFLGINPKVREVERLAELEPILEALCKPDAKSQSVVFSDVSILAKQELGFLEREKITGWDAYRKLEELFSRLMVLARACDKHQVWEFHYEPAKTVDKTGKVTQKVFTPAGPQFPGWVVPKHLAGYFDFIAEVVVAEDLISSFVWQFGFATKPDGTSVRGDRFSMFPPVFPMNYREALRLQGLDIPRIQEVSWMDSAVDAVADKLYELHADNKFNRDNVKEVITTTNEKHKDKNVKHVRWLILDAFDRAEMLRFYDNQSDNLLNELLLGVKE